MAKLHLKALLYENNRIVRMLKKFFGKRKSQDVNHADINHGSASEAAEPICTFQKCLTCPLTDCWTGQVAREQGEEAYLEFLKMLNEAEKISAWDYEAEIEEERFEELLAH